MTRLRAIVLATLMAVPSVAVAQDASPAAEGDETLAEMRAAAERLRPLVATEAAREMLDAVPSLPPASPATVHYRPGGGYLSEAFTAAEYAALEESEREGLTEVSVDTARYYDTFYGSPLASIRAFDLAATEGPASFDDARVLDFGFGSVGQLRLLAACGADAVGTEVMPLLRAIYADPTTQGRMSGPEGRTGSVTMLFGRWPAEPRVAAAAGTGFDLFISKNTIKRGYVKPLVETDPRQRLDFGVDHAEFLDRLFGVLKPGGLAIFYNLGGKPAGDGEDYRPATDIASPWDAATYEKHGFEVLMLDVDDSDAARRVGRALGWDQGPSPMDLDEALFARYTILRRPE